MTARQLIKKIERAIEESGEYDPNLVVNTKNQLTGLIEVVSTPLAQGEQEYYVVLNLLENVKEHAPLSAAASVDHGVEAETTGEHENRAADRGCSVSTCSPSSFSVYDTRHHMHQPFQKPIFGSKNTTVKAITDNTQSQREVAPQNGAPLPDSQHVAAPTNEPHSLEVSEKSRKDHMHRKQWYQVVLDVIGKLLGKKQQESQQRQGKDSREVTGIKRDGQLVDHSQVSSNSLENETNPSTP